MVVTLCQFIKKCGIVNNFRGNYLELTECQGTRSHGDNPLHTFSPTLVPDIL